MLQVMDMDGICAFLPNINTQRRGERGERRCCIKLKSCVWLSLNPPGTWARSGQKVTKFFSFFFSVVCVVVEGNPICSSYIKLQILFVPFLFNGFCFSAKGREENAGKELQSYPFLHCNTIL